MIDIADHAEDEYFAFVESIEYVDWIGKFKDDLGFPPFSMIMDTWASREIKSPPDYAIWLDCIRASYLASLSWRDEICEIDAPTDSEKRRAQINELDANEFIAVAALFSTKDRDSRQSLQSFQEVKWHLIALDKQAGTPILTNASLAFDEGETEQKFMRYSRHCTEPEHQTLVNVFNLNFIPNMGSGGTENAPETSSSGSGGVQPWKANIDVLESTETPPSVQTQQNMKFIKE